MEQIFTTNNQLVNNILVPVIVFLLTFFIGVLLRKILFFRFAKWAEKTKTQLDDIIIGATKAPFLIWCVMLGIYFGMHSSVLPQQLLLIIEKVLLVLGIFSVTLVTSNIITRMIKVYGERIEGTLPVTSLTQNISRIVIFGVGILVILNSLGLSIAPILATLGVGGLAVALALQDTLSNLFAGFHIIMAKQIKVGDYIKLESGQEGYVTDINWRSTNIRMLPNNVVLVPNSKISQSIITNFYLPDKELITTVDVSVHFKSDLNKVENVILEVAQDVLKNVTGGVSNFKPVVRFSGFGDSGVNCSVVLRCREFSEQGALKHEFIKKLHERFIKEGIVIPYPVRAVNYEQEGANKV